MEKIELGRHTDSEKPSERLLLEKVRTEEKSSQQGESSAVDLLLSLTDDELRKIDLHLNKLGISFGFFKNVDTDEITTIIKSLMNHDRSEDEKELLRKELATLIEDE